MELKIIKQKEVPMLSRTRVVSMATFDGATPNRSEVNKKLAAMVDSKPENVVTKHIYTKFGENTAKVISHVYSSAEELKVNERKGLIDKNVIVEEKKEEPAAEEAKEEAPAAEEEKGE